MCQEVGVAEHVLLVHHEAEEGKLGVADLEVELLRAPQGVQAVVRWAKNTTVKKQHQQGSLTITPQMLQNLLTMQPGERPSSRGTQLVRVTSPAKLTHDLSFLLRVVVLCAGHLHLHKRTNDSPPVFGKVPGSQDLGKRPGLCYRWEQGKKKKHLFAYRDIFFPAKPPWLHQVVRGEMFHLRVERNSSQTWRL